MLLLVVLLILPMVVQAAASSDNDWAPVPINATSSPASNTENLTTLYGENVPIDYPVYYGHDEESPLHEVDPNAYYETAEEIVAPVVQSYYDSLNNNQDVKEYKKPKVQQGHQESKVKHYQVPESVNSVEQYEYPSYSVDHSFRKKPSKQKLSDKTWNVPAPYIPPADNLIEDVSFNIGIILTIFVAAVFTLGAIAGILTTKRNGRSLGYDEDSLTEYVLRGIDRLDNNNKDIKRH